MVRQLNFDDIGDDFIRLGLAINPSELHGLLVGSLTGSAALPLEDWLREASDYFQLASTTLEELDIGMPEFYQAVWEQLTDNDLSFALLLPDDDCDLDSRIDALADWCHGFLSGFGLANRGRTDNSLSEEGLEALRDLIAIAEIEPSAPDTLPGEAEEEYYADVVEHVRILALFLFLEAGGQPGSKRPATTDPYGSSGNVIH